VDRGDDSEHRSSRYSTDDRPTTAGHPAAPPPAIEWPFVGREPEMTRLIALLADLRQCGAVVAGPEGVGKTRLSQEFARQAEARGCHVIRAVGGASQRAMPLAALAPLLPPRPLPLPSDPARDLGELLRQARASLLARAAGRRLVLVADDAHLLDDASATLMYQLMTARETFMLCTTRAAEPCPDVLVTAWKDGLAERIELAGPDRHDVAALLNAALGHVDPDAVEILAEQAGRDALVLRELVLGAIADGTMACADGLWRLRGPLTPSARLIELVETRLRGLDPDDRALAEIIAVGQPLSLAELARVSGRLSISPRDRVRAGAERLELAGVIGCDRGGGGQLRMRLARPVYADVLRIRMPELRVQSIAAELARAVAETIGRSVSDSSELLRIGRLFLLSGADAATGADDDSYRDTLLAAAQAARRRYSIPFAQRLVDASLAHQIGAEAQALTAERATAGATQPELFEAELLAAELAGWQGRWHEGHERLSRLAPSARDDASRARIAIAAMDICLYAGRPAEQLATADRAAEAVSDPRWQAEIRARAAPVLVMREGPSATWAAVRPLASRRHGPELVWAALTGARALGRMGRTAAALELSQRGHAAHRELTEPIAWYPWYHLFNQCEILLQAGRLAEAERLASDQHRSMLADHCAEGQAAFAAQLALVLTARGQAGAAALFAREAYVIFRDLRRPMFMRQAAERLAAALALAGRVAQAEDALTAASPDPDADPAYLYNAVDLLHTRAWVAAAAGHVGRARTELREMERLASEIGDLAGLAAALHSTVRLDDGQRCRPVVERLAALATQMDGALVPARLAHARGLAAGNPHTLEQAAAAFAETGAGLLAAEAAADAAARWHLRGEPRRGAAASRLAYAYQSGCEGAAPTLRSGGRRPVLTPAERDAAELALRGHSNKAIAAELVLSVRTIENRLQHVYEKLGINGRGELADALRSERARSTS
jgi:DNA-binding CsgD family transcriptional regulator